MKRTEQAELAELGLTEAQLQERQQKVARDMNINPGIFAERKPGDGSVVVTEARSPTGKRIRSDAGKSRPKPQASAQAPGGGLTELQWARVRKYFEDVEKSAHNLQRTIALAETVHHALIAEAHAYLDSLKGGA